MDPTRYHEFRLFDTTKLDLDGYPRQVAIAGVVFTRPRNEVLAGNDVNRRLAAAIDRILSPDERIAFLGGNPYLNPERCCAQCGHSLGLTACTGCGREYQNDPYAYSTGIDLPEQVREWFVAQGHTFEQ